MLGKALSKAPADRFTTTTEFKNVLTNLAQTPAGGTAAVSGQRVRFGWGSRLLALGVVGAIAALFHWGPWVDDERVVAPTGPPAWTVLAEVDGSAPEGIRDAVRGLLSGDINASGAVEVLSDAAVGRGLEAALMPDTTRVTAQVAKELAERVRIGIVFAPKLDQVGDTYVLRVQVLYAEGDSGLDTKRVSAEAEDALIGASQAVVDSLRPALAAWAGEGVRRPSQNPAVTASLEAYRKRREASSSIGFGDNRGAVRLSWEAVGIDPGFAQAWIVMASAYSNLSIVDSARYAWQKALDNRERLSERIAQIQEALLSRDRVAVYRAREQLYRETGVLTTMYANAVENVGRWEDAVTIYEEKEEQAPFGQSGTSYWNWASLLVALGRVDEAEQVAERLESTLRYLPMKGWVAIRKGDWEEVEELALEAVRDQATGVRWRSMNLQFLASARAAQGQVSSAFDALERMAQVDQESGRDKWYHVAVINQLVLTVSSGVPAAPRYGSELEGDPSDRAISLVGLWAAEQGDSLLAQTCLGRLPTSDLGEFQGVEAQDVLTATLRARIAVQGGDWEEAKRLLGPVTGPRVPRYGDRNQLSHWTLAEAGEALGNSETAATLFAGITSGDYFGYDETQALGLTYSFAHRRAALLFGELGQEEEAIGHWRAFLDAFTRPDPEFEWMVEDARAELARLGG